MHFVYIITVLYTLSHAYSLSLSLSLRHPVVRPGLHLRWQPQPLCMDPEQDRES